MFEPGLKPSDLVGPYEIRGFLGQGGMGTVYRAFDPRLERTVALKVIVAHPSRAPRVDGTGSTDPTTAELSARLFREARAVASLSHPNVVAIYDVGESQGLLYLAMEYVVGATLRALVADESVPIPRRLRWLVDAARALDAAHRAGVIHRDVKPENVMVREDGVVKVLDFGIARRTVTPEGHDIFDGGLRSHPSDTVTVGGAISGTPLYMAPEQIRGDQVDARADQFAWGVMAFELLAGHRPWVPRAGEELGLVSRMLAEPAPPLRNELPELPQVVDETIARTLSKNPVARFGTMAFVADALEPFTASGGERIRVAAPSEPSEAFAETARVPANVSVTPGPAAVEPAKPRGRARARQLILPLALLTALVSGTALYVKRHPPGEAGAKTETERALSPVPGADKAFREATSLFRDGATARALARLRAATDLDPAFAAAHLELALQVTTDDPQAAQASYQRAFESRQMLLPRDVVLLEASEPYVRPQPDLEEWETRLTAAVFQFPRDPELQLLLGRARERLGDDENAKLAYEAALKLDGGYVPALAALANVQRSLGDERAALATTERCVTTSPVATACVERRFELFVASGQCSRARDEAERWLAAEPAAPRAASALARALHADGAPRPGVEEALARAWSLEPEPRRYARQLWDRAQLAAQAGDLTKAEELAAAYEDALPRTTDRHGHAQAARFRMNLLFELDRPKDAARTARDFLEHMDAWTPYPFAPDPSFAFQEARYRAGEISKAALDDLRKRWMEEEAARGSADARTAAAAWQTWALAWGAMVETKEEAQAALAATPRAPLPFGARRPLSLSFALGKANALAGDAEAATLHLSRVTTTCASIDGAMLVVRAHYYQGLVFEAQGAPGKAKASYAASLAAWPVASGSRTARLASARLAALP